MAYQWTIVGAGPAGIAAIGKLLDIGIPPAQILWIDPEFHVGDFGTRWRNVTSNTRVGLFMKFLHAYQSFRYAQAPDFPLNHLNVNDTCYLRDMADPLQWVSDHLIETVEIKIGKVEKIKHQDNAWKLTLVDAEFVSEKIILATGSEPAALQHHAIEEIPLATALDPVLLQAACAEGDTLAVFGSSHSAILILKTLAEMPGVKRIFNFYRHPLKYAVYFDDYILFDDTGLKGNAAQWAKEHIDANPHPKIERVIPTAAAVETLLPQCNKVIYATGFQKRHVQIEAMETLKYDASTGVIAPGIFGLGIAFPEVRTDRFGNREYRVGLWKFVDYLERMINHAAR